MSAGLIPHPLLETQAAAKLSQSTLGRAHAVQPEPASGRTKLSMAFVNEPTQGLAEPHAVHPQALESSAPPQHLQERGLTGPRQLDSRCRRTRSNNGPSTAPIRLCAQACPGSSQNLRQLNHRVYSRATSSANSVTRPPHLGILRRVLVIPTARVIPRWLIIRLDMPTQILGTVIGDVTVFPLRCSTFRTGANKRVQHQKVNITRTPFDLYASPAPLIRPLRKSFTLTYYFRLVADLIASLTNNFSPQLDTLLPTELL